ncbi:hypothetical protein CY34DRAFT_799976 [Suillus luteus UH-Slu-Lm8-n1]|uniref:Uncharacterized protein n=1 Tax=Suillus luteus UH-Slu-Lm8-n1 TaxID=930992 RepID=A0A0D0AYL3_9AGAM|nr:hypothetical protein CY34DRAFT_799976 [Suillus luteus UH-Slu-Lm8-n1]
MLASNSIISSRWTPTTPWVRVKSGYTSSVSSSTHACATPYFDRIQHWQTFERRSRLCIMLRVNRNPGRVMGIK